MKNVFNPTGMKAARSQYSADIEGDSVEVRKQALRVFFELRDKKYSMLIDDLFRLYDFQDIAHGILTKYRLLPIGWKDDLEHLSSINDPRMAWFYPRRVQYLTELTDNYPGVEKRFLFPERSANEDPDRVVDEFLQNEKDFLNRIQVFMQSYVSEIIALSENKVGPDAANALGLNRNEVEFIFGSSLSKVESAAESLLIALETLSLVPASPRVSGGRPGFLADTLMLCGKALVGAYAPYNARYQVAKKLLERKTNLLKTNQNFNMDPLRHLNFVELWNEIAQSKPLLKQLSIDSVLIMPIRRFPNYKLFLERLNKLLPANDIAKQKLTDAVYRIVEFTKMIDDEVKKQGNIEEQFMRQMTGFN